MTFTNGAVKRDQRQYIWAGCRNLIGHRARKGPATGQSWAHAVIRWMCCAKCNKLTTAKPWSNKGLG